MFPAYKYTMGITVNGVNIPDPSEWEYEVSDLDTSGSRDANGTLHRNKVAQKVNYGFSWGGIDWVMLQTILDATNHEQFTLTAPDPRTFNDTYSGQYYVGDRTGKAKYYWTNTDEKSVFDLKLKFIEY